MLDRVLNLKTCKKVTDFDTFSGRVRDLMKSTHFHDWSTSKQRNFDLNDSLRKKCTNYICAKSSQRSIGEVFIGSKRSIDAPNAVEVSYVIKGALSAPLMTCGLQRVKNKVIKETLHVY